MSTIRPFQLLIKPVGADCNLRCDYCFYLRAHELYQQKGPHRMADEVLDRTIANLMGLRFPESVFAWQGGEPTLAGVDFFRKVVELQKKYGVTGQSVGNGFQTNGVLIDAEWCQLLAEYRFLVGLSLDGPEEVHDRVRHDGAKRGSWQRAMAAAALMDQFQVSYNILTVIHAGNVGLGADLVRWFEKQGFAYLQFIPCMEPGLEHNVTPEAYGAFLCDCFDYWSREGFGKISIRDFDALVAMRLGQTPLCTYGRTCNHYILIEHTGNVYPCDFFAYDEWKLGNVMDAPIESFMQTEKYKRFAYQKDKVPECRGCRWRDACHGGCQKDRLAGGTFTDPTPFCSAYKMFFAHTSPKMGALMKRIERRSAQDCAAAPVADTGNAGGDGRSGQSGRSGRGNSREDGP